MTTTTTIDGPESPARHPTEPRPAARTRPVRLRDVVRSEWIKFRSVHSTRLTLVVAGLATVGLGMIFSATASSGEGAPARAAVLSDPVQLRQRLVRLGQPTLQLLETVAQACRGNTR